jgi:hypothetical protein
VGAELRQKAILLTVLGLVFQLIYIAVALQGRDLGRGRDDRGVPRRAGLPGVPRLLQVRDHAERDRGLLTLVGYSVNDTIVIFDRVRENMLHRRKEPMAKLLNDSLNQTLTRTLISNGTTFLAVLGLFLFGGEVLRGLRLRDGGGHRRRHLLHALHRRADGRLVVRRGAAAAGAAAEKSCAPPDRRLSPSFTRKVRNLTPPGGAQGLSGKRADVIWR